MCPHRHGRVCLKLSAVSIKAEHGCVFQSRCVMSSDTGGPAGSSSASPAPVGWSRGCRPAGQWGEGAVILREPEVLKA